jgi:tetratricopeptide (TPR) repeat protein
MAQITLRDYLQETEDAISAGRAEEALARCQHMLSYFPEALEPQRLLGEVHLAQNNLEEARHAFDWVLTSDPEHVVAYCNRALISERMADYDTALDCYQQAYELSRGNGQIRSKFNAISAKAGQQGFMFSRAGLARLYMRGDLLSQAVQEWDAVLAVNPERLDARTGLLETYWREGLYDRVEQLAMQILEDVPTCLKALLLLAHVVSTKNVQRAQELLKQARTLDPDLTMAQLLFADMLAASPAEPFLQLLKQPSAQLRLPEKETQTPPAFANDLLHKEPEPMPGPDLLRREAAMAPDRDLSTWGFADTGSGVWDNEGVLNASQQAPDAAPQEDADLPVWSPSSILGPDTRSQQSFAEPVSQSSSELAGSDTWHTADKSSTSSVSPSLVDNPLFAGWSATSNADERTLAQGQSLDEKASWEESDELARSDLSGVDMWKNESVADDLPSLSGTWSFASTDSSNPAPPSWLSMLTQQDRLQMSGAIPSIPAPGKQESVQKEDTIMPAPVEPGRQAQSTSSAAPAQPAHVAPPVQPAKPVAPAQTSAPVQPAADVKPLRSEEGSPLDEEESLFGPAWLKSLGAYSLAPEMSQASLLPPRAEDAPAPVVQETPAPPARPAQAVEPAIANNAAMEREQRILSTLEEIDQDLRAQGFVSLEPSMLASIAQNDAAGLSSDKLEGEPVKFSAEQPEQDADLSSALAELGNLQPQASTFPDESAAEDSEVAPAQTQEPEWMAALRSFHAPQDAPAWSGQVSSAAAKPQEEQEEEPYWMTPMQAEPLPLAQQYQQAEEPDWMAALQAEPEPVVRPAQSQQQEEEPYWATPMHADSSPLAQQPQQEEPDWMAALQAEPKPVVQPVQSQQQEEEPYWMTPMPPVPSQKAQEFQPAATPDWMEATLHKEKEAVPSAQEVRKPPVSNNIPAMARVNEIAQPGSVSADARPSRLPVAPGPVFEPVMQLMPADMGQPARPLPAPHPEPLLDSELETTMRRPAVRLQHLQQSRSSSQRDSSVRGQAAERLAGKAVDGQVNYKDWLLRGYQHQLSGDYDEAMQAYRIIIKGSPELLTEVVSNVRALLKLAPKYSAGYRVLGDAYMRQGEYLQAMEAYNKALTMAKKTRS